MWSPSMKKLILAFLLVLTPVLGAVSTSRSATALQASRSPARIEMKVVHKVCVSNNRVIVCY
jgi:hypothetical protein